VCRRRQRRSKKISAHAEKKRIPISVSSFSIPPPSLSPHSPSLPSSFIICTSTLHHSQLALPSLPPSKFQTEPEILPPQPKLSPTLVLERTTRYRSPPPSLRYPSNPTAATQLSRTLSNTRSSRSVGYFISPLHFASDFQLIWKGYLPFSIGINVLYWDKYSIQFFTNPY
jgi:hypothetical protein